MRIRSSRANRGMGLESMLNSYHYTLRSCGVACMFKTQIPVRVVDGQAHRVKSEHLPDYIGVRRGVAVAFDAKVTALTRWPFSSLLGRNRDPKQAEALDAWNGSEGHAFLYIRFPGRRDYLVRWADLSPVWWAWFDGRERARSGGASITEEDAARLGWRVGDGGWADIRFEDFPGGE